MDTWLVHTGTPNVSIRVWDGHFTKENLLDTAQLGLNSGPLGPPMSQKRGGVTVYTVVLLEVGIHVCAFRGCFSAVVLPLYPLRGAATTFPGVPFSSASEHICPPSRKESTFCCVCHIRSDTQWFCERFCANPPPPDPSRNSLWVPTLALC